MTYNEAKEQFVQAWGTLGTNWGINRTMAQIHALLMISPAALSTDDIMEQLNVSRGNVNMNLRDLVNWGIVKKVFKTGDRKEYFVSEKDFWELARRIVRERKQRELDPVIRVMKDVQQIDDDGSPEVQEFKRVTSELDEFTNRAEKMLDVIIKSDKNWFSSMMLRMFS